MAAAVANPNSCEKHVDHVDYKKMGKNNHKKKISSLLAQIAKHQIKINLEKQKDYVDEGLIKHWEKEIRAFQRGIEQAEKRLGR